MVCEVDIDHDWYKVKEDLPIDSLFSCRVRTKLPFSMMIHVNLTQKRLLFVVELYSPSPEDMVRDESELGCILTKGKTEFLACEGKASLHRPEKRI